MRRGLSYHNRRSAGGYNPFSQLGPTLDLIFAGNVTNLSDPNGFTLDANFLAPQYLIGEQYTIWETGVGLVSKTFSQIITFTRASTATFTGSNGLIQSAAIDAPRFDYDPSTLAAQGLLIEEQRTNLCLYSGGIGGTGWSNINAGTGVIPTVSTNFAVAPDGTTTASRLQLSLGGGTTSADQSLVNQTLTGTSCRGSFYIKTNDGSSKTVYVRGQSAASVVVDGTWRRYDFDAGTLSGTQFAVGLRGGQTPTNDNTADLLVWGAQLETGSFPTSYIPTVASQVTRSADVAAVNTLSPWYNSATGTLYAEAQISAGVGVNAAFASLDDTTTSNRIQVRRASPGNLASFRMVSSAGSIDVTLASGTLTGVNKTAASFTASDQNAVNNGTLFTGITSIASLPTVTRLLLGDGPGSLPINGHLRRITYYPRRLSNAELQAITA